MSAAVAEQPAAPARATLGNKVLWRLGVPTCFFMLLSSLDRVNISFAALQMNHDLGFTPSQYGFGAGVLFVGFLAGQYPSVLLLQRIGMHRWLVLCAVAWAIIAALIATVSAPWQFYLLRVLLGFAEGGLAPGIVLYLSQFTTEGQRASTFALPMLAIPLSIIVGGPLSGWLMGMHLPLGVSPWRWMLWAEALPVIACAAVAWFYFPDSPGEAKWLTAEESSFLAANAATREHRRIHNDWSVLRQTLVWSSALLWLCLLSGAYGIMFWLPQMIKQMAGLTPLQIGWINALPWIGAMLGTYFNSRHSDKTGERLWHVAVPALIAAIAIYSAWLLGAGFPGMFALTLAGLGLGSAQGAFWAIPTRLLNAKTFAVAAVAINICGSSGGVFMPHLMGFVLEKTGTPAAPTALVAGILLLAAIVVLIMRSVYFAKARTAQ
jgi:ACS family tartrate transporter-like MFS transporter